MLWQLPYINFRNKSAQTSKLSTKRVDKANATSPNARHWGVTLRLDKETFSFPYKSRPCGGGVSFQMSILDICYHSTYQRNHIVPDIIFIKECTFNGCKHPQRAKRLCAGHYMQYRAGKELTPINPVKFPRKAILNTSLECTVPFCTNKQCALGLCRKHYMRDYRYRQSLKSDEAEE